MKKIIILSVFAALATATPAHAQLLKSGNGGLLGIAGNLVNLQTGHISVLNGGLLNNNAVGIANNSNIGVGNTSVSGNNNVVGRNNSVGNTQITRNSNSFNRVQTNTFRRW